MDRASRYRITRRGAYVLGAVALSVLSLTGCGDDPGAGLILVGPTVVRAAPSTVPSTSTTAAATTTSFDLRRLQPVVDALGRLYPTTTSTTRPRVRHVATTTSTTHTSTPAVPSTVATSGGGYRALPYWPFWQCIGVHEQGIGRDPDPWGDGIGWSGTSRGGGPGSHYPGGLGILRVNWENAVHRLGDPPGLPLNGAYATPGEQIVVAREHARVHGYGGWTSLPRCSGIWPR